MSAERQEMVEVEVARQDPEKEGVGLGEVVSEIWLKYWRWI